MEKKIDKTIKSIDKTGVRIGMWLFLYTEIILFGGLFVLYAAYFHKFPDLFAQGGKELNRVVGTVNTAVLLISSFTVAASITALQRGKKGQTISLLLFSIFCGAVFLVNKYFEWAAKFHHDIFPNSATLQDGPDGLNIFFGLYYVITGLHGLHVIIGMLLLTITLVLVIKERVHKDRFQLLENSGLYWHLVDLIWIFVFPLFYLVL
ncbi:cytochrome c oxidase subunit 3 family protein [Desulfobulbus sp. US1]|nr:cytochrome c oxidase subunit 3 family protein [Desulfobulbus sp. US4]MCW5204373.1 cytochrome c oxidase subunit 3 family protein [Desulfobulbus sp. N2]MCW5208745.1 cytochrome c oxidase subunit 3 family protein [Desulfobulbus sp. US1]MCW5213838.1 cytochrome c oxidase subunit 3 family protein [Desulfobulbus sp. US5]